MLAMHHAIMHMPYFVRAPKKSRVKVCKRTFHPELHASYIKLLSSYLHTNVFYGVKECGVVIHMQYI